MNSLEASLKLIRSGKDLSFEQALELAETTDPTVLYEGADRLRKELHGDHFDLCSIINARRTRPSVLAWSAPKERAQRGTSTAGGNDADNE